MPRGICHNILCCKNLFMCFKGLKNTLQYLTCSVFHLKVYGIIIINNQWLTYISTTPDSFVQLREQSTDYPIIRLPKSRMHPPPSLRYMTLRYMALRYVTWRYVMLHDLMLHAPLLFIVMQEVVLKLMWPSHFEGPFPPVIIHILVT